MRAFGCGSDRRDRSGVPRMFSGDVRKISHADILRQYDEFACHYLASSHSVGAQVMISVQHRFALCTACSVLAYTDVRLDLTD